MYTCEPFGCEPLEPRRLLAAALTLFDSGGFEPPRYSPGPLRGQDVAMGPWLKDPGEGPAAVQTESVFGGAQAVRLTRPASVNGDTRYAVLKPFTPVADLDVLRISWDMNVTLNQQPGVPFGPFMGVEAYDSIGFTPLLIGSLGVDATTGDVLYQDGTTGVLTETGYRVTPGQWNHFTLEVDYAADTYTVFVDGEALASTGFVNDAAVAFSDAPLAALAASGDSVATAVGTAHYDNYRIEVYTEPTPPAVTGVYLSGTSWSAPFKGLLEARQLGSAAYGYAVPDGADQLDVLPWDNLDWVAVTFNRDVLVARDDLSVRGTSGGEYVVAALAYDRLSRTALWLLERPLGADKVLIELDGDAAGVKARDGVTRLDGEWVNGGDSFPSGDDVSGGDFRFRVNVLPGDANRSGRVDAADVVQVRARQHVPTVAGGRSRSGYTIFHDVNGDARINALDVARVRRANGSALPPAEPAGVNASVASVWMNIQPPRRERPARPA